MTNRGRLPRGWLLLTSDSLSPLRGLVFGVA
jgi:hypothetical protein